MNSSGARDADDAQLDGSGLGDAATDIEDRHDTDDVGLEDGPSLSRCCPITEFPPGCYAEIWDGPRLWPVGGWRRTAAEITALGTEFLPGDPGKFDEFGCRLGHVNYAWSHLYVVEDDEGCPYWRPTRFDCGLPVDVGSQDTTAPDVGSEDSEVSE